MRLRLSSEGNIRILWFEADMNGHYLETAAMNSNGFFGNFQGNLSHKHQNIEPGPGKIGIDRVYRENLTTSSGIEDLKDLIGIQTVMYPPVPPEWNLLHNLFADRYGNAVVLETSEGHNDITEITGKYLVMTNFPMGEFKNVPYEQVVGAGDDRYKAACKQFQSKKEFGVSDAFAILQNTQQVTDNWETLCSMVFDPVGLMVYLVFNRQFDDVFTVDIQQGTLTLPKNNGIEKFNCAVEGLTVHTI